MSSTDPGRLASLFHAAVDLPAEAREAWLEDACAQAPHVLRELRALLDADARTHALTARPACGALETVIAALERGGSLRGMRIGPFELQEEIGHGGMGFVYRAARVDASGLPDVAVKFMRRDLGGHGARLRFYFEREVLASVEHPNIARLIDAAELDDGTPYCVMELVDGERITTYCARHGLSLRQRVALVRPVCSAVALAHRNHIVHRDLKPCNVLVPANGVPKLLDFGIALPLGIASDATDADERFFSPHYAAPEQLRGQRIGVACDVYGLGLLLHEVLAGAPPYVLAGLAPAQIERLVCDVPAPPASVTAALCRDAGAERRAQALQGDLDAIVARCLRKAPAERYATVAELDAELARWMAGRPVLARDIPAPEPVEAT